jgi:hypothetical protein
MNRVVVLRFHPTSKAYLFFACPFSKRLFVCLFGNGGRGRSPHATADDRPTVTADGKRGSAVLTAASVAVMNATFDSNWVLDRVGELYALHGGTTIGAALSSLEPATADVRTFASRPADLGAVLLFSDGDPAQSEEDDLAFGLPVTHFFTCSSTVMLLLPHCC